jgi:hypothetical protein
MQPTKRITDRTFRYTPSGETNIRQTFARIRHQQILEQRQREADAANAQLTLRRVK